ncbi:PleD family two-component system response regulator [Candidatus Hydrogenedentota bacterium]
MRILIAEDDKTSRTVLETLLKKWGCEVVSTTDGNEAWAVLQSEDAPRLAILDWMMPGMDGKELCQKVRLQETSTPAYIIILTAKARKEDIVAGLSAGANDYITKPFDRDELRVRVQVGEKVVGVESALAARVRELEDAMTHIKTLQGLLPVCMHCHKIRTDEETWQRIDSYIEQHSEAQISHSLCPECLEKYYPEDEEDEKGS